MLVLCRFVYINYILNKKFCNYGRDLMGLRKFIIISIFFFSFLLSNFLEYIFINKNNVICKCRNKIIVLLLVFL